MRKTEEKVICAHCKSDMDYRMAFDHMNQAGSLYWCPECGTTLEKSAAHPKDKLEWEIPRITYESIKHPDPTSPEPEFDDGDQDDLKSAPVSPEAEDLFSLARAMQDKREKMSDNDLAGLLLRVIDTRVSAVVKTMLTGRKD